MRRPKTRLKAGADELKLEKTPWARRVFRPTDHALRSRPFAASPRYLLPRADPTPLFWIEPLDRLPASGQHGLKILEHDPGRFRRSRRFLAPDQIPAHRFSSLFKMASNKPLKIPLFRLASGRTQVDDRLGISLQKLAQRVPFRHIPHRHDFYHVAWIESGAGTFIRDDKSYPIKAGSLIFVPPGQVHTWESKEALHGYILSLEPTLLFSQTDRPHRLFHELTQWSANTKSQIGVTGNAYELLKTKFEDLAGEFCTSEEFRDEMLRTEITSILISLHRLCRVPAKVETTDHFHPVTNRFLALLEKEEGRFYRANHYVSALSVDSRAFVNAVLSETGKSPSVWIRDRTLLEARRLLTYTDLTISEIAYRLNFRNVSYFVRFYRRLTGISPGAARTKSVKSS